MRGNSNLDVADKSTPTPSTADTEKEAQPQQIPSPWFAACESNPNCIQTNNQNTGRDANNGCATKDKETRSGYPTHTCKPKGCGEAGAHTHTLASQKDAERLGVTQPSITWAQEITKTLLSHSKGKLQKKTTKQLEEEA
jgi:hypothetical protein